MNDEFYLYVYIVMKNKIKWYNFMGLSFPDHFFCRLRLPIGGGIGGASLTGGGNGGRGMPCNI